MARIEENPLSDWAMLLQQIVRAALECKGVSLSVYNRQSEMLIRFYV